jgi:hypothetical protein
MTICGCAIVWFDAPRVRLIGSWRAPVPVASTFPARQISGAMWRRFPRAPGPRPPLDGAARVSATGARRPPNYWPRLGNCGLRLRSHPCRQCSGAHRRIVADSADVWNAFGPSRKGLGASWVWCGLGYAFLRQKAPALRGAGRPEEAGAACGPYAGHTQELNRVGGCGVP